MVFVVNYDKKEPFYISAAVEKNKRSENNNFGAMSTRLIFRVSILLAISLAGREKCSYVWSQVFAFVVNDV